MSFYAFAIMALAFEMAQRYDKEKKKKEKVSVEWFVILKIQFFPVLGTLLGPVYIEITN